MKPSTLGTIALIIGVVLCLVIGINSEDVQALFSLFLEASQ